MGWRGTLSVGGAAAAGLVVMGVATGAGQPQANPDYGFVLSTLHAAFYRGDEKIDCPQGRSPSLREAYLMTLPPAERERLSKPENATQLEHGYKVDYVYGKGGKDICTNAAAFDTPDRPVQNMNQSKVAPGMDLDGGSDDHPAAGTCAHKSFTGVKGEGGVDNQFFRAIGCNTFWRGALSGGEGDGLGESILFDGAAVMVVKGVHNWANEPRVQVIIASSEDKPPKDVRQKILDGGSMGMTETARYRIVANGRIEDGVLTTDPVDLVMPDNWVGKSTGELIVRHMRLRVKLQPNGDLSGVLAGYRPFDNVLGTLEVGGPGVASVAGVDCASVRKTLRILADGDPDPKTGACTTVSEAFEFAAKPAFIFDKGVLVGAPGAGSAAALKSAQR
jgi:hypothetical protein